VPKSVSTIPATAIRHSRRHRSKGQTAFRFDVQVLLILASPISSGVAPSTVLPRANNEELFRSLLQLSLSEIEELKKAGVI
jgi:hypothetical protein